MRWSRGCSTACDSAVPIAYGAKLVELVKSNGRVEGAVVDIGDKRQTIRARRGVILATGGFGADTKMQKQYNANAPVEHTTAFAGASGDGFKAGQAAGGAIDANHTMDSFYFPSSLNGEINFPHILLDRAKPGLIAVNKDGRRFVNESASYHDFVEAMLRTNAVSPCIPAWLVCDRSFIRDYGIGLVHPGAGARTIERYIADGYLKRAGTLMELAAQIGVDGKTLAAHRAGAQSLRRDRHGRSLRQGRDRIQSVQRRSGEQAQSVPAPDQQPPYFAVAVYPSTMGTCVGLATDGDARVLDENGAPIGGSMRSATTWRRCFAASMWAPASRSGRRSCSPIAP